MTPTPQNILRRQLRQARRALKPSQQIHASLKVRLRLGLHLWFRKAQSIAFYWPSDGEISPLPLMKLALAHGKHCYLPAINTVTKEMVFRRYQAKDNLVKNAFNIPEPTLKSAPIKVSQLDLILLPLVGFDDSGNRLGMGGGYYDRALACNTKRKKAIKGVNIKKKNMGEPKRIGLAHECQCVPSLVHNYWDIPMHAVATQSKLICF